VSYDRFLPTGRALITLAAPNFLRDNLRLLDRLTIAGTPVSAEPTIVEESRQRTRGTKGRAEAEERGVAAGNGPHAGLLQNTGKMVVIWGFPGKMDINLVAPYFKDFKVATSKNNKRRVQKVPLYVVSPMFRKQTLILDQTRRGIHTVFTLCCHARICVGSSPLCATLSYDTFQPCGVWKKISFICSRCVLIRFLF
jgi:hypothetical protein